jgi:putative protease
MRQVEILAPAGSIDGLKAAINASCDAVYIGGTKFGARAFANNLEEDTMLDAIDFAHIHNKKIYMTVNTLLKNSEVENQLYDYLRKYYEHGLDAVIVQDVGVLHFIHNNFPGIDIHGSTQMSITMAQGAQVLKDMGLKRLVNARELGLDEIKTIREQTDLEIESFVHGALCYCYSGQCLMSSMFGGRSGNRGRCAQPCRMPYGLLNNQKNITGINDNYLLSPKDICTLDMIPDLIKAGIDSFKIEGRMKRPEYAAGVTYAYRKYVDKYLELGDEKYEAYLKDHKAEFRQDTMLLLDLYNRGGFTNGYYTNRNGKSMITLNRPNHSGVLIGEVTSVNGNKANIRLVESINPQDILEIRDKADNLYEFTVKAAEQRGQTYSVNFNKGLKIRPGNQVYRTKNNQLLNELSERYLKDEIKEKIIGQLYIQVSEKMKLNLTCRDITIEVQGDEVEEAKNQPMMVEKIRKQMMKTGDTSFEFSNLEIHMEGNVFVPVQKLNELRREALLLLANSIAEYYRRDTKSIQNNQDLESQKFIVNRENLKSDTNSNKLGISVSVSKKEQLEVACNIKEVTRVYIGSDLVPLKNLLDLTTYIKSRGKECFIILPHIFRKATYGLFLENKSILEDNTIDGYVLRNLEEFYFITKELPEKARTKELITDYNLYVMNKQASEFWKRMGVSKFTTPVELNYNELKELSGMYYDMIVYGKIPLMVSAGCVSKTATGGINTNYCKTGDTPCCGKDGDQLVLIDRYQKQLEVKRHCRDCYNVIYNSQSLSLLPFVDEIQKLNPKNIRLNFTFESSSETKDVIESFIQSFIYHKKDVQDIKDYTRGHFKRGIE